MTESRAIRVVHKSSTVTILHSLSANKTTEKGVQSRNLGMNYVTAVKHCKNSKENGQLREGRKTIRPKLNYPKKLVVEVVTSWEQVLTFNTYRKSSIKPKITCYMSLYSLIIQSHNICIMQHRAITARLCK